MTINIYQQVYNCIQAGQQVNLLTTLNGQNGDINNGLSKIFVQGPDLDLQKTEPLLQIEGEKTLFYEPIAPKDRLIVLGGGHIALPLCEFSAKTGFHVVVIDDRPEFANKLRFPWAAEVYCENFEKAIDQIMIRKSDYITVITRGHRHDADCLRKILDKGLPYYLGMIGSKRRVKGLFEMLEEEGYNRQQMNKICTPIGLNINAVLPEEIAISILAELISCKRKSNVETIVKEDVQADSETNFEVNAKTNTEGDPEIGAITNTKDNPVFNVIIKDKTNAKMNAKMNTNAKTSTNIITSDLDLEVITYLATVKEPIAVITVMETKGSTPRGAGAKMLVNQYGKIQGSIGGGCAEKDIINKAIRMIGTGKYRMEEIDLTGEVAESEGMVCGGMMKVLIEDFC